MPRNDKSCISNESENLIISHLTTKRDSFDYKIHIFNISELPSPKCWCTTYQPAWYLRWSNELKCCYENHAKRFQQKFEGQKRP